MIVSLHANAQSDTAAVCLMAFGDVNLGRTMGQRILRGELDYPFDRLKETLHRADAVFVNLESVISDQQGQTEHPRSNYIFCAPPPAAVALREAGVTVAATANNHSFDYGSFAVGESIRFLAGQGIASVGSSIEPTGHSPATIIERKGIRFAFLAYTQIMNMRNGWRSYVAGFDSLRVQKEIREARSRADVVVVSYHGGSEYRDRPSLPALTQMRYLVDVGADFVIGHHPHVPQGIEQYRGRWIAYSLGNLVFYQPQQEWTQLAIGLEMCWTRSDSIRLISLRVLPIRAGYQPFVASDPADIDQLRARLKKLSNVFVEDNLYDSTVSFILRP